MIKFYLLADVRVRKNSTQPMAYKTTGRTYFIVFIGILYCVFISYHNGYKSSAPGDECFTGYNNVRLAVEFWLAPRVLSLDNKDMNSTVFISSTWHFSSYLSSLAERPKKTSTDNAQPQNNKKSYKTFRCSY